MSKISAISFQSSLLENLKNSQQIDSAKNSEPPSTGNNNSEKNISKDTASGAEALANYNKAGISGSAQLSEEIKPYKLKAAEQKPADKDFTGKTKVTTSDNIVYYEETNGDITTIYHGFDDSDILSTRIEINNKTGNRIREDVYDKDGNTRSIVEYNPETGIRKKCTCFNDENYKPDFIAEYDDDGKCTVSNAFDNDGKLTRVKYLDKGVDGNSEVYYELDEPKIAYRYLIDKNGNKLETAKYVNGQERKAFKHIQPPVINTTGVDYKEISNLTPAELGDIELDISKVDGEKIYRSNNTLEEIKTKVGNLERNYTLDETGNKLKGIYETENGKLKRTITIDNEFGNVDSVYEVFEDTDDKYHSKTTLFNENGQVYNIRETIEEKPDISESKSVTFDNDGDIAVYGITNKKDKTDIMFSVNKNGDLIDIKEWEANDKLHNEFYHDTIAHSENIADKPDADKFFNDALNDDKWEKQYIEKDNCVTLTCPDLKDGAVYHIFENGTVACHSCQTGDSAIIKNSNEEIAKKFNEIKNK